MLSIAPLPLDVKAWDRAVDAEGTLDEAAVLVASQFTANAISHRELRGLFLMRADGKWVATPRFTVLPPTIGLGQARTTLDADIANTSTLLRSWRSAPPGSGRIDWALKALLTDEPWSEFVWWMFSLEEASEEHRARHSFGAEAAWASEAVAYVRAITPHARIDWRRPSTMLKFAAAAANLAPLEGASDMGTFYRLKQVRDRMLHGTQADAPETPVRRNARELCLRYNRLLTLRLWGEPALGSAR
jgi:hypothetical protein